MYDLEIMVINVLPLAATQWDWEKEDGYIAEH